MIVLFKFEMCFNSRQDYTIWKLNTDIQTKNMNCQSLVKCMKKKAVIIRQVTWKCRECALQLYWSALPWVYPQANGGWSWWKRDVYHSAALSELMSDDANRCIYHRWAGRRLHCRECGCACMKRHCCSWLLAVLYPGGA